MCLRAAVLNSTDRLVATRYSRDMPSEPSVDTGFAERWAAWQARGAENDRHTRRVFFIVAAFVILLVAIVSGMRWW